MTSGPGALNRIYKLVWSEASGSFIAVAEHCSGRGKRSSAGAAGAVLATLLLSTSALTAAAQAPPPQTLPVGAQVAAGQVSISQSGARMDLQQSTAQAVLNWQSFNIGANAQVHFQQPNASATALNRVLSADPSAIFGRLTANGQVLLVNPNGILFGAGAQVDVGGIAASTLRISDADFLAGRFQFERNGSSASVVNQGEIRAADGAYVALLAPEVRNEGVLQAQLGTVALAAGEAVTLSIAGQQLLAVKVDPATIASLVENRQLIQAEGGQVLLSAGAAQRLAGQAIAADAGATRLVNDNGVMRLVAVGGQIDAGAGRIEVEGRLVDLSGALSASSSAQAQAGGQINIQADTVLQSGSLRADARAGQGGQVALDATQVIQTAAALLSADGASGGGTLRISGGQNADGALGSGQVFSSGSLSAQGTGAGAQGGQIDISANSVQLRAATLDASGPAGGGRLRVGGGYQGADSDITNAQTVGINAATTLRADAQASGQGGTVVVWSDQTTTFAGQISARGGAAGGDGGLAEVSGQKGLAFAGQADLSAAQGAKGRLLLDPRDIVIDDAASAVATLALQSPDGDAMAEFGSSRAVLDNGNVVITAPAADTAGVADTGAVYLFNSRTGALLGHLRGSHENDRVGNYGIEVLANQNYLVYSGQWDNTPDGASYYESWGSLRLQTGQYGAAGAVTWQSSGGGGASAAIVSTSNSLIGDKSRNERITDANRTTLSDGNLVFVQSFWNNGRGAVTWLNTSTGQLADGSGGGLVSASNSLVGSLALRPAALQEGGLLITGLDQASPGWANYNAGPLGGTSGVPDQAGRGDEVGSGGITVLAGGAYVVASPQWSNGPSAAQAYVGAVNYGAAGGVVGEVSASNSLHGSSAFDFVGSGGVTAVGLANSQGQRSNYVVASPYWGGGGSFLLNTPQGAVTWVDGATGKPLGEATAGATISAANSLVGSASDLLGSSTGGSADSYHTVVNYLTWYDYCNCYGNYSTSTASAPRLRATGNAGITVLDNGNYLVASTTSGGGKGSVSFGLGNAGLAGLLGSHNSLVGANTGDAMGSGGIMKLADGHYAVISPEWDGPSATNAGAVTWGASTGTTGVVSAANSLVGGAAYDQVGSGGLLGVGSQDAQSRYANYLVLSPYWGSGAYASTSGRGAVSWVNGASGLMADGQLGGTLSALNSLVGGANSDYVGSFHHSDQVWANSTYPFTGVYVNASDWNAQLDRTVDVLANGNYLVRSPSWQDGRGAATWGHGQAGVVGEVSSANSLVGERATVFAPVTGLATPAFDETGRSFDTITYYVTHTGDHVGLMSGSLPNGNVAVISPFWNDGRGAVSLLNGSTGHLAGAPSAAQVVSASNSLVGSTPDLYQLDADGRRLSVLSVGDHVGAASLPDDGMHYVVPEVSRLHGSTSTVVTDSRLLAPYQLGSQGRVSYTWIDPSLNPSSSNYWDHMRSVTTGKTSYYNGKPNAGLDALANGHLLVRSPFWNNGDQAAAGAVSWMNGSTGQLADGSLGGLVSAANSLVGGFRNDQVGRDGLDAGSHDDDDDEDEDHHDNADSNPTAGIVPLANGHLVVRTQGWNSQRGAATWLNSATGQLSDGSTGGAIGTANSLVGSSAAALAPGWGWAQDADGQWQYVEGMYPNDMGDRVGTAVYALPTGDFVVASRSWGKQDNPYTYKGAVTWLNGATGQLRSGATGGEISALNSLVGTQAGDQVASYGVQALDGGRYVVNSPNWANGEASNAGAVTFAPAGGVVGEIGAHNSLVGDQSGDRVGGSDVRVLRDAANSYTNYLVLSGDWHDGQGAATWVDGRTGLAKGQTTVGGTLSAANSLVGLADAESNFGGWTGNLYSAGVATGDVVIRTSYYDSNFCGMYGSITVMPGASGLTGEVGWRNSLLDFEGAAARNAGWANANVTTLPYATGVGELLSKRVLVTTNNGNAQALVMSLVTENPAQPLGTVGQTAASQAAGDGSDWRSAGFAADAAGFAAVGGSGGLLAFGALPGANLVITPAHITHMLNAGTAVTLQASNQITVAKPVLVSSANGQGGDFTLQAGRGINILANIDTDNGHFSAVANVGTAAGVLEADCGTCAPSIRMADGVGINAGSGNISLNLLAGEASGDIVLGSLSGANLQVNNAQGAVATNRADSVVLQAGANGQLDLRASAQLRLGEAEHTQTVALQAGQITLRAGDMGHSTEGSLQLQSGVSLSGQQLWVGAYDAAAQAQWGGTALSDDWNAAHTDFWLAAPSLDQLLQQTSGFNSVTLGRTDQNGVSLMQGMTLNDGVSAPQLTVQAGSGGLHLAGEVQLGAAKHLTLAAQAGAISAYSGFSVEGTADGASTLTLHSSGSLALQGSSINLPAGLLDIQLSGDAPAQLSTPATLVADTLRLQAPSAAVDLSSSAAVQLAHLAADVGALSLVNNGSLQVSRSGDLNGVQARDGLLLQTLGAQADLALDAPVRNQSGDIVLAAGRNFSNHNALDTGLQPGEGRYQVYSANPAQSLTAMSGASKHYNQAYEAGHTPAYASAGNWFHYSVAPVLQVGAGQVQAVYGSSDAAAAQASLAGFIDGDDALSAGISGQLPGLSLAGYTASGSGHRPVGSYTTSYAGADLSGLASSLGYRFEAGSASGSYEITPLGLSASGSRVYDGSSSVAAASLALTGPLAGDNLQLSGSAVGGRHAGADQALALGSLSLSGADAANYSLSGASATITQRGLAISAHDQSKVYGAADASLGFDVGGAGLASGDSLASVFGGQLATATGAAATAGRHAIVQGSLQANADYRIDQFVAGQLSVAQAALTVTADDQAKTYGDVTPTLSYTVNTAQLKYGDGVDVVSGVTLRTAEGAAATAGQHAIHASGGVASNYSISTSDGLLNVARAALQVSADDKAKTYGEATPSLSYTVNSAQLKYGDGVDVVSGVTLRTAEGAAATAGSHTIHASGALASNYAIRTQDGQLSVAKAGLSISADDQAKTYGDATPTLSYTVNAAQLKYNDGADVVSGVLLSTAEGAAATAGRHAINASGGVASNYTVSSTAGQLAVAQAALTVTADDQAKTYGDVTPTLSYTVNTAQLKYGDGVDVVSGVTLRTAEGAAATAGQHAIHASGGVASNYTVSTSGGLLNVARAALQVSADNKAKTYGETTPGLSYTVNTAQLKYGDGVDVVSGVTLSTAEGAAATAGSHTIHASGAVASNYAISTQTGQLSVAKAGLSISADDQAKTYGDATPTLSYTVNAAQLKYNDGADVVSGVLLSTAEGAAATAGRHAINASGGVASNYAISTTAGQLVVAQAALTVTADDKTKIFGQPQPALSYTVDASQLKYGDQASVVTGAVLSTVAMVDAIEGSHPISLQGASAYNYSLRQVNGSLTVMAPRLKAENLIPEVSRDSGMAGTTSGASGASASTPGGSAPGSVTTLVQTTAPSPATPLAWIAGQVTVVDGGVFSPSAAPNPSAALNPSPRPSDGVGIVQPNTLGASALTANVPVLQALASPGQGLRLSLPADLFTQGGAQVPVQLEARLESGAPLPSWLRFDASTGQLEGTPPAGSSGQLRIRIVGRSAQGAMASTTVELGITR